MADTILPPTNSKAADRDTHDEIWGRFKKFYSKNEEMLEKCINTDVRTLAKGEKVAEIEQQIDSFSATTKIVLDGLAELGKIHPIIGAAVVAFHAVISLDLAKRDNDRKVTAIMLEMQNMMCAMFQLRHLNHAHVNNMERDEEKSHLDRLIKSITDDITQCGSDINYYLSQKFVLKMVKAWNFEARFKEHVATFAVHRSELQTAITAYIAGGVDHTVLSLATISAKVGDLASKLDVMFKALMRKLDTTLERETQEFFRANGGIKNCITNDDLLARLLVLAGDAISESEGPEKGEDKVTKSRRILQEELQKDFNESLKQNTIRFEKLLAVQNNNHERVIAHLEKQEGYQKDAVSKLDKLLLYMHPETKLNDPEVQRIWDHMGLKTSVNAKDFVLTFRDHYEHAKSAQPSAYDITVGTSKMTDQSLAIVTSFGDSTDAEDPNAWLLEYIDAAHVRPVVEAMDVDGSGFISVKKINAFARSKPNTWSFLQLMAYWAAGWHINVLAYRDKIYDILIQMHELLPLIHPANQFYVDQYLDSYTMGHIEAMLWSTQEVGVDRRSAKLKQLALFYSYIQEDALKTNLKELSYIISSPADANLIAGAGAARVESWIYPLLYLLLQRHLAIMTLAKSHILHDTEMESHENSLQQIMKVFLHRRNMLQAVFSQTSENVAGRFQTFAYGMFFASYKEITQITPAKSTFTNVRVKATRQSIILGSRRKKSYPDPRSDLSILARDKVSSFHFQLLNIYPRNRALNRAMSHPLGGYWCGVCLDAADKVSGEMGLVHFSLSVASDGTLSGTGECYRGSFGISGHVAQNPANGFLQNVDLKILYETSILGVYDAGRDRMYGNWANGRFSFTRTSAEIFKYRVYLSSTENSSLSEGRRRWIFATEAIRHQVQAKQFSWDHVRKKFAERKLWVSLTLKHYRNRLATEETDIMHRLIGEYHPAEARLYRILAYFLDQRLYAFKVGASVTCDYCGDNVIVSRFRCITCMREDLSNQIDLCADKPACIASPSTNTQDNFTHVPSHTLLRSNYFVHDCDLVALIALCRTRSDDIKRRYRILEEGQKAMKKTAKPPLTESTTKAPQKDAPSAVKPMNCICCGMQISLPCWACAICAADTAICLRCEKVRATVKRSEVRSNSRIHSHDHLVLLIYDNKEVHPREVNNSQLQQELSNMTADLRSLEQKVISHLQSVTHALQAFAETQPNPKCLVLDAANAEGHNNAPRDILGDNFMHRDSPTFSVLSFNDAAQGSLPPAIKPSIKHAAAKGPITLSSNHPEDTILDPPTRERPQAPDAPPPALTNRPLLSDLAPADDDHHEPPRDSDIDARVKVLDTRLDALDKRISGLEKTVDGRFSGLENQIGEILVLLKKIPQ